MLSGESIVCFAGEDWWYHNPHSNLHIMKCFAKNNRVLFVNSIGLRMPDLRKPFAGTRIVRKLKSILRHFRKAEPNLWVLTPLALPVAGRWCLRVNEFLLAWQVRFWMGVLGFRKPILWAAIPSAKDAALRLRRKAKALVYYCVDNYVYGNEVDGEMVRALEAELHEKADVAFFVNHALVAERGSRNPRTHHLGHGVDFEHFAAAQNGAYIVPADIAAIPRPIAGYIGAVTGLDWNLVRRLAEANPGVSFAFIGETASDDVSGMKALPNMHFLGKKTYAELPAYLAALACCCLFYDTRNPFNRYRNPKKLLEYLATGKPVVSVPINELESFRDTVVIAEGFDAFNAALRRAVAGDTAEARERRIARARRSSWESVAEEAAARILETRGTRP